MYLLSNKGVRTVKENKDKGPIFLDLRPGPDKNKAVRQTERCLNKKAILCSL